MNRRITLMSLVFVSLLALILLGAVLPAASAPSSPWLTPGATKTPTPLPLVSFEYLSDISLITEKPCGPPCFHGIIPGKTTFTDALQLLRKDPAFRNVQSQRIPPIAVWSGAHGQPCCQMSANQDTGLIDTIAVKLAPHITTSQIIDHYGPPRYVTYVDYSQQEVSLGLVFPEQGLVTWIATGDPKSRLDPADPVVVVLYTDPNEFSSLLDVGTFQGWNGYLPYETYKEATPIVTPIITVTPGQ